MGDACAECDRHTITLLNTQNIAEVAPTRQILHSIMHIIKQIDRKTIRQTTQNTGTSSSNTTTSHYHRDRNS